MGYPHFTQDCSEHHHVVKDYKESPYPEIITLCGSTRFKQTFLDEMRRLTLEEGAIVIPVGLWGHDEGLDIGTSDKPTQIKIGLDQLHFRKIDISNRIHVINVEGYIGSSTQNEIEYATKKGLEITYFEQLDKI